MNKFFKTILWGGTILTSLLVAGCAKEYDDSDIRSKIDGLDKRLTELEATVKTLNETTVPNIQKILEALQAKLTVSSVNKNADGSYTIVFSDNSTVNIANGAKGDKGDTGDTGASPVIGIQLVDGVYCWTINGELIKDADGKAVPVNGKDGENGITPIFRTNTSGLEYSIDGGATWIPVPVAEGSIPPITFEETESSVIFTFADGTSFEIAKELAFGLKFSIPEEFSLMTGETGYVPFTVEGVGSDDIVEVGVLTATPGYEAEAELNAGANNAGFVIITNKSDNSNSTYKVYVFAANGKGKTDIKGLSFSSSTLKAVLNVQTVPAAGGDNVVLSVKANEDYDITLSAGAESWITVTPPTRALYNDELPITVAANETNEYRFATITLTSKATGEILDEVDLVQGPVATEATSLASVEVIPDGTTVTVYNVSTVAADDAKAVITDGTSFMYVKAAGLYEEGVFDFTGTKKTDALGHAFIDVKSLNMKMDAEPIIAPKHDNYNYYGVAANDVNYFFTVNNGTLSKSGDTFYVTGYAEPQQLVIKDAPAELGLDALVGKFIAVKGWVIGADTTGGKEDIEIIATSASEIVFAEETGWAPYYGGDTSDEPGYPEIIGLTVASPVEGSYYTLNVFPAAAVEEYESMEAFIAEQAYEASDNLLFNLFYYGNYGYEFDFVFDVFAHSETYDETFQQFAFGKYYILATGLDEDAALTGKFAIKEFEKVSPYVFNTYADYLGQYTFTNSAGVEEVWTFEEKVAGESYSVSGIGGITAENLGGGIVATAEFDAASGMVSFSNQELGIWDNSGTSLTDKFVAVWYNSSSFNSNESYMESPLIMSFANNEAGGVDLFIESDDYGLLEGFGYLALKTGTTSVAGRYAAVKFDGAKIVKGIIEVTTKYEDFLGEWSLGSAVWNIAEDVPGESYLITGINGQSGYNAVSGIFDSGKLKVYEAELSYDPEGYSTYISGIFPYGSGRYISFPFNADTPGVLFTGSLNEDGTISLVPGANSYATLNGFCFISYMDDENNSQSSITALPNTLKPYVYIPDKNVYIYKEDFEAGADTWTLFDADADGYNWGYNTNLKAHSGVGILLSKSYDGTAGPLNPDNWAFTPAITLTADNYLSFWITAQDQNYSAEHYGVYILGEEPTAENLSSAVSLLAQTYPAGTPIETADEGYQHFVLQIPADYANKTVYIGFRHFDCTDMFYLNLDDVAIIEGEPQFGAAPAPAPRKAATASGMLAKSRKSAAIGRISRTFEAAPARPAAPQKAKAFSSKLAKVNR